MSKREFIKYLSIKVPDEIDIPENEIKEKVRSILKSNISLLKLTIYGESIENFTYQDKPFWTIETLDRKY